MLARSSIRCNKVLCPYHFIEVMGCPAASAEAAIRMPTTADSEAARGGDLLTDEALTVRASHDNPIVKQLYDEYLGKPLSHKGARVVAHALYQTGAVTMLTPENLSGTMLLIDRERLVKEQQLFEAAGFTVHAVSSAEDGWQFAREQHPDIIVLEVMLERPDAGFTLAYRLRKDAELAHIPVLLLSSVFQTTGTILDLNSPIEAPVD